MIKRVLEKLKKRRIQKIQATIHGLRKQMSSALIDLNWKGETRKAEKISNKLQWKIHKMQLKLRSLNK